MKRLQYFIIIMATIACACNGVDNKDEYVSLQKEAVTTLQKVLQEQNEWVKVHAAEFLIWTGNAEGVKEHFIKELEQSGNQPQYRIGIRRVLAQVSKSLEKEHYQQDILQAFLDTTGKDRIHAAETLAKLKISPYITDPEKTAAALNSNDMALQGYTHWAMAYTNDSTMAKAQSYFVNNLTNPEADIVLRRISSYVLRYIGGISNEAWNTLADNILAMPDEHEEKISLLTTTIILADEQATKAEKYQSLKKMLLAFAKKNTKTARIEIANALVAKGTKADLTLLQQWLRNEIPIGINADDADVQASAAYAILSICERVNNH